MKVLDELSESKKKKIIKALLRRNELLTNIVEDLVIVEEGQILRISYIEGRSVSNVIRMEQLRIRVSDYNALPLDLDKGIPHSK